MKAIFTFPALLAFPLLFLRAGEPLYALLSRRIRWSTYILDAGMLALLILYVLDVSTLIIHLYVYNFPFYNG